MASVSARALIEAVAMVMSRAKASGLESYEEAERLLDPDLERRLYGAPPEPQSAESDRVDGRARSI